MGDRGGEGSASGAHVTVGQGFPPPPEQAVEVLLGSEEAGFWPSSVHLFRSLIWKAGGAARTSTSLFSHHKRACEAAANEGGAR